jgi:hypothetical protein
VYGEGLTKPLDFFPTMSRTTLVIVRDLTEIEACVSSRVL